MRKFVTGMAIIVSAASLAACGKATETATANEVVMNEDVVVTDEAPVLMNDGNMVDGNIVE